MTDFKHNQGNQTEAAKRKLICYIQDQKLREGDSLPPQSELRKLFRVGAFTIQRAIAALQESGILETIPHHAVRVKSLNADGYSARQIALVCLHRSYIPSSTILLQCLQQQLANQNCQCKLFLRNSDKMTEVDSLSDFDGLQRCIEQGIIHGILTTVSFDEPSWKVINDNHIPVVSTGTASHNKGCKVSFAPILPQAFDIIKKRSLNRPALIHCGYPVSDEVKADFTAAFPQEADRYCRFLFPELIVEDSPLPIDKAALAVLDDFCAMPPAERPDVLIIPDDFLMNFVYTEILRRRLRDPSFDWQPHFIYLVHTQNRFFNPAEPIGDCFEYDIMQCAKTAVQVLHSRMTGNSSGANEPIRIEPKLSGAAEFEKNKALFPIRVDEKIKKKSAAGRSPGAVHPPSLKLRRDKAVPGDDNGGAHGDTVEIEFHPTVKVIRPDPAGNMFALKYGPLVLAADRESNGVPDPAGNFEMNDCKCSGIVNFRQNGISLWDYASVGAEFSQNDPLQVFFKEHK